jgi:hypothetical protein
VHKEIFIGTENAYLYYISKFGDFLLSVISVSLKQDDMENATWLHLPPQYTLRVHRLQPQGQENAVMFNRTYLVTKLKEKFASCKIIF